MNVENILKVADAIEQHSIPDLGFNISYWVDRAPELGGGDRSGHNCGTTACIAGWAVAVERGAVTAAQLPFGGSSVRDDARLFLDLRVSQALSLFEGFTDDETTPSQAVSVLRHLAKTGEVDWDRALSPTEGERG